MNKQSSPIKTALTRSKRETYDENSPPKESLSER